MEKVGTLVFGDGAVLDSLLVEHIETLIGVDGGHVTPAEVFNPI
jgi:hypothetical protein